MIPSDLHALVDEVFPSMRESETAGGTMATDRNYYDQHDSGRSELVHEPMTAMPDVEAHDLF